MKYLLLSLVTITTLTACTHPITDNLDRIDMAQVARPAFMVDRTIDVNDKTIPVWERMHQRHAPATLYIGGWDTEQDIPLGLSLAARDQGQNIAWMPDIHPDALHHMASLYDLTGFHIVVTNYLDPDLWSNLGATKNILSLRTVAASFPSRDEILNTLSEIPQVHFVGGMDEHHTPAHYHDFRQSMGMSSCVRYAVLPDADEAQGWTGLWPKLLKIKPECRTEIIEEKPQPPQAEEIPVPPLKLYQK